MTKMIMATERGLNRAGWMGYVALALNVLTVAFCGGASGSHGLLRT